MFIEPIPLASYQIVTLSALTGNVTNIYDSTAFLDMRYSIALNGIGTFAMTLPGSDENYDTFELDTFIEVQRTNPATDELVVEETYLTRIRERFREGDEELIVVGGVSLNHLLLRRIVDPDDDPLQAGGYSTKSGPAGDVIREYVRQNMGSLASSARQFPDFSVPATNGIGDAVGARLRFEGLLDEMTKLAKQGNVDFQIKRTAGRATEMQIGPIGTDRTRSTNEILQRPWTALTPQRNNLTNPRLREDRKDETNTIYALGQGQGDTRIVLKIPGAGSSSSPYNRIEFQQDFRSVEKGDALALLTSAQAELGERVSGLIELTFQPTGQETGNIYHLDWEIGDRVTIIWGNVERDIRITGLEIDVSKSGEEMAITIENVE